MKQSKQVIIMRRDLRNTTGNKIRTGKLIAQGAHASMKAILDQMKFKPQTNSMTLEMPDGSPLEDWIEGRFTKVCLSVDSEKDLVEIYNKAKQAGLICSLITDAGVTEFGGVATKTCCAIGPAWAEDIDKITGELKLL